MDPTRIKLVPDPTTIDEAEQRLRDEEDEILCLLHRELESVDRRVTRSRARAYKIQLHEGPADAESSGRRGARRGKLPIQTPRARANEAVRLIHTTQQDDAETGTGTSEAAHPPVPMMTGPEYDDEGNVITEGYMLDSPGSSSSSDDEF